MTDSAHVAEFLLAARVYIQVFITRVLADDHPFIHRCPSWDEEHAALLQVKERIGNREPFTIRHQSAVGAALDRSLPGRVAIEQRVDDTGTARIGKKVGAETDQSARRNGKLQPHPT